MSEGIDFTYQNRMNSCVSALTQQVNEKNTRLTSEDSSETSPNFDNACFKQEAVNNKSKVIVQVLPASDIAFGSVSALKQFASNDSSAVLCKKLPDSVKKNSSYLDSWNAESNEGAAVTSCVHENLRIEQSKLNCNERSKCILRRFMRQRHNLNFHVRRGSGIKLGDIDFISSNLNGCPKELLRILHYILFDTYGPIRNEKLVEQTRQNILLFSGYPFGSDTPWFDKKRKCLLRLPFQILCGIYDALIGKKCKFRPEIVDELLSFFMKPSRSFMSKCRKDPRKVHITESRLKELAVKGPSPFVLVERLSDHHIAKALSQTGFENYLELKDQKSDMNNESYFKPAYVLSGPGCKLKMLPKIVTNVHRAQKSVIFLLHHILYGVTENIEVSKQDILEFSGFSPLQKDFAAERKNLLASLRYSDIQNICSILSIQDASTSKVRKIQKILRFLHKPSPKHRFMKQDYIEKIMPNKTKDGKSVSRQSSISKSLPNLADKSKQLPEKSTSVLKEGAALPEEGRSPPKECTSVRKKYSSLPKLRDFKNICFNVECATPEDLSELNDLLFVKPCDDSDIHQKILDFTEFTFNENSFEYHYRKTLMHYMNFCIIRKIAKLLDITDWESFSDQQGLSSVILQFLMEMSSHSKPHKKERSKLKPSINTLKNSDGGETHSDSRLVKCTISEQGKESSSNSNILKTLNVCNTNSDSSCLKHDLSEERNDKSNLYNHILKNSNCYEASSDLSIAKVYQQQADGAWNHRCKEKVAVMNFKSTNFDHPYSMLTMEKFNENKGMKTSQRTVYIHKLIKSSYPKSSEKNFKFSGLLSTSQHKIHESAPFTNLLSNPSDRELETVIQDIMRTNLRSISMNDLIKEVVLHFPMQEIFWNSNMIITKARKILSELLKNKEGALTQYHRLAIQH